MLLLLVIVASVVVTNAIPTPIDNRIIGGKDAQIETYPYQVSLQSYGMHDCGASIISSKYIVTAGHCVNEGSLKYITVRAGSSKTGSGGTVHHVDKVILHEKYDVNEYGIPLNDIAIMRVKEAFKFDDTCQPIPLVKSKEETKAGTVSVITGWGRTEDDISPTQLQTVNIPILEKAVCHKAYKKMGGLPKGQICAAYYGVGGKDACQGDSGGPLAVDGRLVGIVSWGDGCAEPDSPGVYTDISHFRDWIKKHAKV